MHKDYSKISKDELKRWVSIDRSFEEDIWIAFLKSFTISTNQHQSTTKEIKQFVKSDKQKLIKEFLSVSYSLLNRLMDCFGEDMGDMEEEEIEEYVNKIFEEEK